MKPAPPVSKIFINFEVKMKLKVKGSEAREI